MPRKDEYHLWCCISGQVSSCFGVRIAKDSTVDDLKDAIKAKAHPTSEETNSHELTLKKVLIPLKQLKGERNPTQLIQGGNELDPSSVLSDIFEGVDVKQYLSSIPE
jgi:hypothetical protein